MTVILKIDKWPYLGNVLTDRREFFIIKHDGCLNLSALTISQF